MSEISYQEQELKWNQSLFCLLQIQRMHPLKNTQKIHSIKLQALCKWLFLNYNIGCICILSYQASLVNKNLFLSWLLQYWLPQKTRLPVISTCSGGIGTQFDREECWIVQKLIRFSVLVLYWLCYFKEVHLFKFNSVIFADT